jgi:hypothetical protein
VIPVQELEAWILADLSSVSKVITSWAPKDVLSPESINDPKEHLERLSKEHQKPKYIHAIHNQKIAHYLISIRLLLNADRSLHLRTLLSGD